MSSLISEINKLERLSQVDKKTLTAFKDRIDEGEPYTKPQNKTSHFCALFIPLYLEKGLVYIGDHIKAKIWSPPGGHLDLGEGPVDTVKREFKEELSYELTNEDIELFDANVTVCIPTGICRLHFDFFYLVYMRDRINFKFDTHEYKDADWFSLEDSIRLVKFPQFNAIMKKLKHKHNKQY